MNDYFKRGLAIDITEYEVNPVICIENETLAKDNSKEWISWEKSFEAYLDSCTSIGGAPLFCIIRKDLSAGTQ